MKFIFTLFLSFTCSCLIYADTLWETRFDATDSDVESVFFTSTNGVIEAPAITLNRILYQPSVRRSNPALSEGFYTNTVFVEQVSENGYAFSPKGRIDNGMLDVSFRINDLSTALGPYGTISSITFYLYAFDDDGNAVQNDFDLGFVFLNQENADGEIVTGLGLSVSQTIHGQSSPSNPTELTFNFNNMPDFDRDLNLGLTFQGASDAANIGIAGIKVEGTVPTNIPEPATASLGLITLAVIFARRKKSA